MQQRLSIGSGVNGGFSEYLVTPAKTYIESQAI